MINRMLISPQWLSGSGTWTRRRKRSENRHKWVPWPKKEVPRRSKFRRLPPKNPEASLMTWASWRSTKPFLRSPIPPPGIELARGYLPKVEDEQIVNNFLIGFLGSLAFHAKNIKSGWSPVQKAFNFGTGGNHLANHSLYLKAILRNSRGWTRHINPPADRCMDLLGSPLWVHTQMGQNDI